MRDGFLRLPSNRKALTVSIPTPPENGDYLLVGREMCHIFRIIQDFSGQVQDFASLTRVSSALQNKRRARKKPRGMRTRIENEFKLKERKRDEWRIRIREVGAVR
jgi:hypothetical protein